MAALRTSLIVGCCIGLLSACATKIPVNETYGGGVYSTNPLKNASVTLDTAFKTPQGDTLDKGLVRHMNVVLADALKKHGIGLEEGTGASSYRLQTVVQVLPGKSLWKAEPQRARNLGMAVIPIGGLFTPRYYTVSSGFSARFSLYKGEALVMTEDVMVDEEEEVSVSPRKQVEEATERALRFWEAKRDLAIAKFFSTLAQHEPRLASLAN